MGVSVAIGAFIGAASAVIQGGDPLKGAVFGAAGGAIGGQFFGPAAATGESTVGGVIGQGATTVANEAATQTLAQTALQGATGVAEQGAAQVAAQGATQAAGGAGGAILDGAETAASGQAAAAAPNSVAQGLEGVGAPGSQAAAGAPVGLVDKAMAWANANQRLAAAVIQGGSGVIGGIGQGLMTDQTMKTKAELELENKQKLTEYYRNFVQNGSAGARVPIAGPSGNALTRPGGQPVYGATGRLV